ncbi:Transcription factor TFIIIB component B [Podila minutissima]|nr:Transcription factor TFIIIB component B [Podila minutissima]
MSGISTRIEKGQTRFAPKLKARPNRRAATASEDGTPAPTPSLTSSDAGTFGASLLEGDTDTSAGATGATDATPSSSSSSTASRRLSAQTPMSPPSSFSKPGASGPKSPNFTPTKVVEKPGQGIAITFPSSAGSSSSTESQQQTSQPSTTKGASIITVPSARSHVEREDEDGDAEESAARKRAKGKHVVRPRHGEEEVEGEDAMPDYSDTPMYEFVKDMGTGRRSQVFLERQKQIDEKRRVARKERRIKDIRSAEGRATPLHGEGDEEEEVLEELEDGIEKEEEVKKAKIATPIPSQPKTFAPQVRVVDGRIELDLDSLTVDHAAVDGIEQGPIEYVDESSTSKYVNSATFSNKFRSEKWSEDETELFYKAIAQWGTDFGIICKLFPSKTRIAIRNKFKREDRYNRSRVEAALSNKEPIDLDQYSQMTGADYPEVNEDEIIKKLDEAEEGDTMSLLDQEMDDLEYEEPEEEIFDDGEEIIGEI